MTILTTEHPLFTNFITQLEGPGGCDVCEDGDQVVWNCQGNFAHATRILTAIGSVDVASTFAYFEEARAFCDCEILFNTDEDF